MGLLLFRKPLSKVARAITRAYTGSLYIPNDANCFQDSAGTTPATKDSVVGKLLDSVGTNHATQATTGYKPILRKGAKNLLPNGAFSGTVGSKPTGWTVTGSYSASAVIGADQSSNPLSGHQNVTVRRQASTGYEGMQYNSILIPGLQTTVQIYIRVPTGLTASDALLLSPPTTIASAATLNAQPKDIWVRYTTTFTPNDTYLSIFSPTGAVGTGFDICAVMPGIGSTASTYVATTSAPASNGIGPWWLDFDGTDDRLSLASVPFQMADDHFVVASTKPLAAGRFFSVANTADADSRVADMSVNSSGYATGFWKQDDGSQNAAIIGASNLFGLNNVISLSKQSSSEKLRVNSTQVGSASVTFGTTTVDVARIGCLAGAADSNFARGPIYALALGKGTITDSEIAIIERYIGSLGGIAL